MLPTRRTRLVCFLTFVTIVIYFTSKSLSRRFQSHDVEIKLSAVTVDDFYVKTLLALEQERSFLGISKDDSLHNPHDVPVLTNSQAISFISATALSKNILPSEPPISELSWVKPGNKNNKKLILLQSEDASESDRELYRILSLSPVVIFSKSTCPYSELAKKILLEKYTINPKSLIVELDLHWMRAPLQKSVAALTGRATVPNILIYGQSIGGADEIADMHKKNTLITKIIGLGGSNLQIYARD